MAQSPSPQPVSRPRSEPDLFFPSSDSEDEGAPTIAAAPVDSSDRLIISNGSTSRSDRAAGPSLSHRDQPNGVTKLFTSSQDSDIIPLDDTPNAVASSSAVAGPSSRKRPSPSRSPSSYIPSSFSGGYLGEFACEGWSLSKGKGYCVPGSKVIFERPKAAKVAENGSAGMAKDKTGPTRLVNGKVVKAPAKVGGKQVTLGSMMTKKAAAAPVRQYKPQKLTADPTKPKKPPGKPVVDQIIRFRNDRGFEGERSRHVWIVADKI